MAEKMTLDKLAALMQEEFLAMRQEFHNEIQSEIGALRAEMRAGFDAVNAEFKEVHKDQRETNFRLGSIEKRQETEQDSLDSHDRRLVRVEKHLDLKPLI